MVETEGTGETSYTPTANTDFKPLEVDVNSVADLGKALTDEANHFGDAAKPVIEQLSDAGGEYESSEYSVGVDPTQETLRSVSGLHSERTTEMAEHMTAVETGLRNLGRVTQAITARFGDQDSLNSASVGDISEITHGTSLSNLSTNPGQSLPLNPEQDA